MGGRALLIVKGEALLDEMHQVRIKIQQTCVEFLLLNGVVQRADTGAHLVAQTELVQTIVNSLPSSELKQNTPEGPHVTFEANEAFVLFD